MTQQRGFTLVELSIVLVILGLLIGGVLTGQSLIRAAELRSVTTQEARYVTATQTFRDKYFALPGDMPNATAYWGAADGSTGLTNACYTTAGTGTQTCNGNADGKVTIDVATTTGPDELFRFWQHLANAGLIEGGYDGIAHGTTNDSSTTLNSPAGRISSSYWSINNAVWSGMLYAFDGDYGNFLKLGGLTSNNSPVGGLFKPEEVYNIDMKVDDGMPATGKVVIMSYAGHIGACANTGSSSNFAAVYILSGTTPYCAIIFRNQF